VLGWLSIGCWIIVYSPQIYENHSRRSGEGLSVAFVITWLLGDFFNLVGAVMAGLIPTIIVLACYYSLCDLTLLFQIYYYRAFYSSEANSPSIPPSERSPLLNDTEASSSPPPATSSKKRLYYRQILKMTMLWMFVIAFGIGAFLYDRNRATHSSPQYPGDSPENENKGESVFEWKSQVLGWLSAILYLGSRIPQIKKNMETRCEGLSLELFMFAIGGNAFYVLSICVLGLDRDHIVTNASWLAGSGLTIFLDFLVLGQFFHYQRQDKIAPVIKITEADE